MRPKTIAERIATIAARCHRRRLTRPPTPRRPADPWARRLRVARSRREQLEAERQDWERLVRETGGQITQIAYAIGCDRASARRAIWDLGLWPMLVQIRAGADYVTVGASARLLPGPRGGYHPI